MKVREIKIICRKTAKNNIVCWQLNFGSQKCKISKYWGGQNLITDEGCRFKKKNSKTEFGCHHRCVISNCFGRSRINLEFTKIIQKSGDHSHKPDLLYNDEEYFRQKILTKIQNDPTKPVKMIYDEQVKLNSEIENPSEYHKISSGLLKKRNQILPKIPRNLQNVKKVGMWNKTSDNQDFVLHQDVGLVDFDR